MHGQPPGISLAATVHWQGGAGEGPQLAGHAWQELFAPTQHPWLHCLPALLWQQWFETQSEFFPHPAQPVAMLDAAIAAVGAAMLVISGAAAATAAPV